MCSSSVVYKTAVKQSGAPQEEECEFAQMFIGSVWNILGVGIWQNIYDKGVTFKAVIF